MKRIYDISDKGRKQGKAMRYEVGYFCKPIPNGNPDESLEEPEYVAKFRRYGDALTFANFVANAPDPTLVIIRS